MNAGEAVFFDNPLGNQDGVFEVVTIPRHKRDTHILPKRQLTHIDRRPIGKNVSGTNYVTGLSGFGVVALTGVVVNDSLVMVDYVNRKRSIGLKEIEAARQAGMSRFRPIILTSLTTFAGLTPLLLEKSLQAKFLIPMGISLGFGVIFATVITLILVPSMYLILEDIRSLLQKVRIFLFGPK